MLVISFEHSFLIFKTPKLSVIKNGLNIQLALKPSFMSTSNFAWSSLRPTVFCLEERTVFLLDYILTPEACGFTTMGPGTCVFNFSAAVFFCLDG